MAFIFSFLSCIRSHQAAAVGCLPSWDAALVAEKDNSPPPCISLEQLARHEQLSTQQSRSQPSGS